MEEKLEIEEEKNNDHNFESKLSEKKGLENKTCCDSGRESKRSEAISQCLDQEEDDIRFLHRAVSTVYVTITKKLDVFVEAHKANYMMSETDANLENAEFRFNWTTLHREYEKILENELEAFCEQEGLKNTHEIIEKFKRASSKTREGEKMLKLLLNAADFPRFCRFMRRKL